MSNLTLQDERELELRRLEANIKQYRLLVKELDDAIDEWFYDIRTDSPSVRMFECFNALIELAGLDKQ